MDNKTQINPNINNATVVNPQIGQATAINPSLTSDSAGIANGTILGDKYKIIEPSDIRRVDRLQDAYRFGLDRLLTPV